jgi:hypothetical protein
VTDNDQRLTALARKFFTVTDEEATNGFSRPILKHYIHTDCPSGREIALTELGDDVAEMFARSPRARNQTYCGHCRSNQPVKEFVWVIDGQESTVKVGT